MNAKCLQLFVNLTHHFNANTIHYFRKDRIFSNFRLTNLMHRLCNKCDSCPSICGRCRPTRSNFTFKWYLLVQNTQNMPYLLINRGQQARGNTKKGVKTTLQTINFKQTSYKCNAIFVSKVGSFLTPTVCPKFRNVANVSLEEIAIFFICHSE